MAEDENENANEKSAKDRADQLHELIDRLEAGAERPDGPAPTGPAPTGSGGESLREAVHRRMRELRARGNDTEEEPTPDDGST
ncbi:hypothetical protein [Streptomyces sp. NPDC058653]|uniref:hypothetical protein n=1 Tax=Streptomyces sp. NPDC058653 TaxID=3346576 RepID=UPI0036609EF2